MASVKSASEQPRKVVICGGGVIGSAIAYFLSLRGVPATIIERTEIACATSGVFLCHRTGILRTPPPVTAVCFCAKGSHRRDSRNSNWESEQARQEVSSRWTGAMAA